MATSSQNKTMSFSLCTVIAEAFKTKRQQLKPAAGASECTLQFTGQLRRSGCTPAEPYPPGCIKNMQQESLGVSFGLSIFNHSKSKKCVTHVARSFRYLCP